MTFVESKKSVLLLTLAVLLQASAAVGAQLVLRERATVGGSVIRLGDVADISAGTTTEMKDLATTPLFPAPAPGTQQFLYRSQILDLLQSRGLDIQSLRVRGAKVVEIGDRPTEPKPESNWQTSSTTKTIPTRSQEELEASIEAAILQSLVERTGHERWRVAVEIEKDDTLRFADWGNNFTVDGGRRPWTGRQRFQLSAKGISKPAEVRATVVKVHSVLFARTAITRGSLVRAADVEVREHEGSVPSLAISDPKQVIGMVASRTIAVDTIFTDGQVSAPKIVKRGETVTVFARTGGITVRTMAVARQDGAMGDLVQVESVDNKKRFAASVTGDRRLDVYPTGARVEDFAMYGKQETERR